MAMNEFSLIDTYFNTISPHRNDVIFGIGDDAACLQVPNSQELLVSTDTLVEGVHFLGDWDPYQIASRALRVNISDIAAMGAIPCWVLLALTIPMLDEEWLERFSTGLADTLREYNVVLVGGDTTRGPMTVTMTIHGLAPKGQSIRRSGAKVGDKIYVTGPLGAAGLAVHFLNHKLSKKSDKQSLSENTVLMDKLLSPKPRIDFMSCLRTYATAAIDISDGLSADLNHILQASQVGACLTLSHIPVHPLVIKHQKENAIDFALGAGDDYELCFTVSHEMEQDFKKFLLTEGLACYCIGVIEQSPGLRVLESSGQVAELPIKGYCHF